VGEDVFQKGKFFWQERLVVNAQRYLRGTTVMFKICWL